MVAVCISLWWVLQVASCTTFCLGRLARLLSLTAAIKYLVCSPSLSLLVAIFTYLTTLMLKIYIWHTQDLWDPGDRSLWRVSGWSCSSCAQRTHRKKTGSHRWRGWRPWTDFFSFSRAWFPRVFWMRIRMVIRRHRGGRQLKHCSAVDAAFIAKPQWKLRLLWLGLETPTSLLPAIKLPEIPRVRRSLCSLLSYPTGALPLRSDHSGILYLTKWN